MKSAEVTAVYKKERTTTLKNKNRLISILPTVSKVYERIIQKQLSNFIEQHLSPSLFSFRKAFSSQHALVCMFEKWHKHVDSGDIVGAILMHLSKAFDYIKHDLLTVLPNFMLITSVNLPLNSF